MPDQKDALQVKIDKARLDLPEDARAAIDAVDWRGAIMQIRNKEGYDFVQLGELETETELLLCGLANPEDYPRQIEKGMGISHEAAQKLVSEMNEKVFKKIKEEMIKVAEGRKTPSASPLSGGAKSPALLSEGQGEGSNKLESREEILSKIEQPEKAEPHPLLAEKLSKPMQIPSSKTIHSLDNLTKPSVPAIPPTAQPAVTVPQKYSEDPYREKPE